MKVDGVEVTAANGWIYLLARMDGVWRMLAKHRGFVVDDPPDTGIEFVNFSQRVNLASSPTAYREVHTSGMQCSQRASFNGKVLRCRLEDRHSEALCEFGDDDAA